ncbi:TPA: NAD(P)-dependent alcohol dehydrogenase, partial [Candidatus Bathyarchaeota archaeon]|nr:NAD(P)-dependent alcohol dehydrogenase [Candidatus Bathyarchaeota archaeon]
GLIEPVAVAVNAAHKGEVRGGDVVAVLGAGPIGLVTLQVAKASGATRVYVTDKEDYRLRLARKLGADEVIDVSREDPVARMMELTEGVDVALEASGAISAAQDAIRVTRRAGRVVLIGMYPEGQFPIKVLEVPLKELTVRGVLRYAGQYEIALELVSSGKVNVRPLITHRFPLEELERAIRIVEERSENVIKAIIRP